MRDRKWQQRITLFLGIFLSFGMVAGLVLPLIQTQITQNQSVIQPTSTPRPTQPPPPDTASISFDNAYLHPAGLYTAQLPTNYTLVSQFNRPGEAQLTLEDNAALSVMEIRVLAPAEGVTLDSAQSLGEQFTESWLRTSWNRYTSWREDARSVDDGKLIMDFTLERGGQDYIARQIAFTNGTWIYTTRLVMPSNASEALQYILNNTVDSIEILDRYLGQELDWNGYFDDSADHLIRYPQTWTLVDSGDGLPASFAGDNTSVRVEAGDATIDSADAASAYVAGLQSNINVLSVEEVNQFDTPGYRVAYTRTNLDGETLSGAVLILNGEDGSHIVNVLLDNEGELDLNTVDTTSEDPDETIVNARKALDSFSLFPGIDVFNS